MVLNPIRLNWHYVIWYRNFTLLIVSLVVPFVLLAYWNFNTLSVLLRRRRLRNRPPQLSASGTRIEQELSSANPTGIRHSIAAVTLNGGMVLPVLATNPTFAQGI